MTNEIVEYLRTQTPGEEIAAAIVKFPGDDYYLLGVDANERFTSPSFGMFLKNHLAK